MAKKKKVEETMVDENELLDDTVDATDEAVALPDPIEKKSKEDKKRLEKEEKAKKKAEEKAAKEAYKKEHGVVATFNMYKFIIKIIVFAILVVFGILLLVFKAEFIGVIFMFTGIVFALSALIRIIPLFKTLETKEGKLVMGIELAIHFVLGAYLIIAAIYHFGKLDDIDAAIAANKIDKNADILEQLEGIDGGKFALFNISAYPYLLVGFFYTLAIPYYINTVLYKEKTRKTLFVLMTISITLAVIIGIFADRLPLNTLIVTLAAIAFLCAVVIGGEAAGGFFNYRKKIAASEKKEEEKEEEAADGIETPAADTDTVIEDINPSAIPVEEPTNDTDQVS
ncbi:MAG: hypothetical protein K6A63_00775 [Acholeplasmatales bacterium]|nr:hypothetical protein [Acholeplasmatales bacterium]